MKIIFAKLYLILARAYIIQHRPCEALRCIEKALNILAAN